MDAPVIMQHAGISVVRDDLVPGGTKARYFAHLFQAHDHVVYASPTFGGAQLGLAYAARAAGKKTTLFVPERQQPHARTLEARQAGARVFMVPAGRLSVLQARARRFAADEGAFLLPFGGATPEAHAVIAGTAAALWRAEGPWDQVWCAAGSGVLTRGLQQGMPLAKHCCVQVGRSVEPGRADCFIADVPFETEETGEMPFPSCRNYDAKAWFVMRRHLGRELMGLKPMPRVLFWNVVGPSPTAFAGRS